MEDRLITNRHPTTMKISTLLKRNSKFAVLIFSIFFSCKSPKSNSSEVKTIQILEMEMQDLHFDNYDVTALSSDPDHLLGSNPLIKTYGDDIFILNKGILRFDKSGRFVNRIGTLGDGPGEYPSPSDFLVIKDTLLVLSQQGSESKISKYLTTGEFISELTIQIPGYSFEELNSGYIIKAGYSPDHKFSYYVLDNNFEIVKEFLERKTDLNVQLPGGNFFPHNNSVFIHEPFDNNTYKVEDQTWQKTYELDFANYAIPEEFFSMDVMNGYNLINKNGFGMINRYFENDHYSVFEIMLQKQNSPASIRQVVYSKKKDTFFSHEFRADSESEVLLKHLISLTSNDELVYMVFPYSLKDCNDKILDEIFPDKEYEKISDTANPLIIKCKISRK